MNVLYGLYRPDSGRIFLRDRPVTFHSPRDAIRAGIVMIHQHFMLVPPLSVGENIALGYDPLTRPWLNLRHVEREVHSLSAAYGLDVDPRAIVWQLPVGQQQRVEILKALYRRADILILDEPTAVLTPQEADELLAIMRELAGQGKSIIFITHKLREVLAVAAREETPFAFPDPLWVRVVLDFAVAYHRRSLPPDPLLRSLVPLYLGRTAAFVRQVVEADAETVEVRIRELASEFLRQKGYLRDRWEAPAGP